MLTYRATGVFNFSSPPAYVQGALLFTAQEPRTSRNGSLSSLQWVVVSAARSIQPPAVQPGIPNSNNMAKLVTSISLLVGIRL